MTIIIHVFVNVYFVFFFLLQVINNAVYYDVCDCEFTYWPVVVVFFDYGKKTRKPMKTKKTELTQKFNVCFDVMSLFEKVSCKKKPKIESLVCLKNLDY